MTALRLFIAVDISAEQRVACAQLLENLKKGVQFTKADAAFVKAVQERTAPVEDRWAAAAEAKGLKDAKKVLAEFRAEIKKLEK